MIRWAEQYTVIARKSFAVLMNDPFFFLINLLYVGASVLIASLPGFTFGEHVQLLRDQTLAMVFSGGCLAAALGAGSLITEDIQGGILPILMSRPVKPSALIFGKWTGLAAALALLTFTGAVSFLWTSRLIYNEQAIETLGVSVYILTLLATLLALTVKHYLFRGNFLFHANIAVPAAMAAALLAINFFGYNGGQAASYGALVAWNGFISFAFIMLAIAIFAALMCLFAVFSEHAFLLSLAAVTFMAGLFTHYFANMVTYDDLRLFLLSVLPGWQTYWLGDAMLENPAACLRIMPQCLIQAAGQSFVFLLAAVFLFCRRQIGDRQ